MSTSATVEREAQKLVRPYQGMAAWPTVTLALAVVVSFAAVCWMGATGVIPLWAGMLANTVILYVCQTPVHEACHGNIAGRDQSLMWLNHLIGIVCGMVLLHEYKAFRALHLMHHRDTNNAEFDPDHYVKAKNPLSVLARCLTIVPYYNHFFFKYVVFRPDMPGNKETAMHVVGMYWMLYTAIVWLCILGYWEQVLLLWIVPHILASAVIIFFFAYLTHEPHGETDRFRDANIFVVRGPVDWLVNWMYCFQNYHLIHHLFPRVPFYRYPEAFRDLRPVLDSEGAHIWEIGEDGQSGQPVAQ